MRYLITGSNGQLARAFIKRFEKTSIDYSAPDETNLDITKDATVADAIAGYQPDVILNCAAYNFVDQAEHDREKAFAINALGPKHLAIAAAGKKITLVHFGSDYVFDGEKERGPYTEGDPVNPLNQYGWSKLSGEEKIRESCNEYLVFRLSWVYGDGKQNFIHRLTEWARHQDYLKIACDEFSVPTNTDMVVDMTLKSLDAGLRGLFHLTNSGFCSRYEWATFILKKLGIRKFVLPVSMDLFHLPAKRPKFSPMSNAIISSKLGVIIDTWEESLEGFLQKKEHEL
jgi:dTDP-4-dehydrorhamnose reductase